MSTKSRFNDLNRSDAFGQCKIIEWIQSLHGSWTTNEKYGHAATIVCLYAAIYHSQPTPSPPPFAVLLYLT